MPKKKTASATTFKQGDKVQWVSQAGGSHVRKVGVVESVVTSIIWNRIGAITHYVVLAQPVLRKIVGDRYAARPKYKTVLGKAKRYRPVASLVRALDGDVSKVKP